jgi:hypothetical protein
LIAAWLQKYGVTHGTTAEDWLSAGFSRRELAAYFGPDQKTLEQQGLRAIFLGYYFPWDPETSLSVAKDHGFQFDQGRLARATMTMLISMITFISLHHWMKWYKFGFTRLFDNLSLEIRNGRMTRDRALAIIQEKGGSDSLSRY